MENLPYNAERSSYGLKMGEDVATSRFIAGLPRQRLIAIGVPHTTPLSFILKGDDYDSFMQFIERNKAKTVGIKIPTTRKALNYKPCKILGSPDVKSLGFDVFEVSINIVVTE